MSEPQNFSGVGTSATTLGSLKMTRPDDVSRQRAKAKGTTGSRSSWEDWGGSAVLSVLLVLLCNWASR